MHTKVHQDGLEINVDPFFKKRTLGNLLTTYAHV
jgi:hypothetical protein